MPSWAAEMKRFGSAWARSDQARGAIARGGELFDARAASADQGELGGDEEAVGQNEQEHRRDAPQGGREIHVRGVRGPFLIRPPSGDDRGGVARR